MEFDSLSKQVIGFAIELHCELGLGLLESTYETRTVMPNPSCSSCASW